MVHILRAVGRDTHGTTLVEYALIVSLISFAVLTGYEAIGGKVQNNFNNTANAQATAQGVADAAQNVQP